MIEVFSDKIPKQYKTDKLSQSLLLPTISTTAQLPKKCIFNYFNQAKIGFSNRLRTKKNFWKGYDEFTTLPNRKQFSLDFPQVQLVLLTSRAGTFKCCCNSYCPIKARGFSSFCLFTTLPNRFSCKNSNATHPLTKGLNLPLYCTLSPLSS